jgi:hypothetical protein
LNDVITIENTEMQIREYDGERVVTFKDIDTVHQRPAGTARKAFYRNKKRFEENKHYISLKPKENPNVRLTDNRNISIPNKGITLITERGYLLLVKAFTDDLISRSERCRKSHITKNRSQRISRPEYRLYLTGTSGTRVGCIDFAETAETAAAIFIIVS